MSGEPKMFRINPDSQEAQAIPEKDFASLGWKERRDIQEWIAAHPDILGDDLLIVGKEFSGFDLINERLDLLAVDGDGRLVVIELKRDDTGADVHWQAIKYASYLHNVTAEKVVSMLAAYGETSENEAIERLLQHLNADDLNALNNDQRIILVSHRFAPQVTSASLWLNEKSPNADLITCIQLVPYHDQQTNTLFVQASTIIPLPASEDFMVTVGDNANKAQSLGRSSLGEKLSRTFRQSIDHESTPFLYRVRDLAISGLSSEIKPNRRSKWAGRHSNSGRYYHLWYSRTPWANWNGMSYRINLWPQDGSKDWRADVEFWYEGYDLAGKLAGILPCGTHEIEPNRLIATVGVATLTDGFSEEIADTVRMFIEAITPVVNVFVEEGNEEEG